ncbi:hypothetical protein HMPREF0860_0329 [Treponema socranskii subsp. socranskii VPI DR56BR1116 = ATCC 35536]|uniref:Uncharacterized protein n=1 Tax=Treponema socranskii subsp. socranskii VPI DR56BR1116 = ATCC 35536 TaxID=1125725 RepID=U2MH70_TRESO|nr:hypothetical protein HMPREF1325_1738 [Treponema socranskii subsp. socranskii VPI DR56BR1116 = ATCC 35536]ERJ98593.1 hypothetical protein HMPREF0860_0329 [Treponema socranskii subsp. socranskii VPI DR56BR1116 = ATCC 35536]
MRTSAHVHTRVFKRKLEVKSAEQSVFGLTGSRFLKPVL